MPTPFRGTGQGRSEQKRTAQALTGSRPSDPLAAANPARGRYALAWFQRPRSERRLPEMLRSRPIDLLTRPICFAPILLALSGLLSYLWADRTMPVPDEGALLTAAVKILRGGVFYRDVDAYAFPGVSYLLAGAMSIFGEHLSVARAIAGAIFCATVLGVYACALALMDEKRAALCGASLLSLKFIAFPIYTMFFYADASVAAALLALALFLRHRFDGASLRLFLVGILTGLSVITKQSTGIAVSIVFLAVIVFPAFAHGPRRRPGRLVEAVVYVVGLLAVAGSMSAYFASQGVFGEMIRAGLLRPFTGYLPTSGLSFLPPLEWWQLGELRSKGPVYYSQPYLELVLRWTKPLQPPRGLYLAIGEVATRLIYTSIPVIFGAIAWSWLRAFRRAGEGEAEDQEEHLLARAHFFSAAGVCLAITLSAFPRADFIHVITVYPAVVLMIFAFARPSLLGLGWRARPAIADRLQRRRRRVEAVFVTALLLVTGILGLRYDSTLTHRLSLDRAELWVRPRDAWLEELVAYIRENVPEGEPLFVYGHEAHWYFLSDRYTPRRFSQVYPGMTGDENGKELARLIQETRPRVIIQGVLRWPGMPSVPDYVPEFESTLERLYRIDRRALDNPPNARMLRIWRRRDAAKEPEDVGRR